MAELDEPLLCEGCCEEVGDDNEKFVDLRDTILDRVYCFECYDEWIGDYFDPAATPGGTP